MSQQPPPPPGYGAPPAYPPPGQGYAPPPQGYPAQGHQTTVVMAQPVVAGMMFREAPVAMQCPYCSASITTSTTYETGTMTWVIAGILLLFGLWLGCCLIPFCVDGCKDVIHRCPSCNQVVGKYNRM
ncbi:hypothetical protein FSP39_016178 [Pinctada imbricata]|uniref:LITAF domain-containing protein n=1 Tax=Pinctada imbricata TaxID=66713 RepID=A0AA88XSM7_PINIB|nr:hypothetical protein FSP39_016178 [Pinctada imbricata]